MNRKFPFEIFGFNDLQLYCDYWINMIDKIKQIYVNFIGVKDFGFLFNHLGKCDLIKDFIKFK